MSIRGKISGAISHGEKGGQGGYVGFSPKVSSGKKVPKTVTKTHVYMRQ